MKGLWILQISGMLRKH